MINKFVFGLVHSSVCKTCFSVITIQRYNRHKPAWCFNCRFSKDKEGLIRVSKSLINKNISLFSRIHHVPAHSVSEQYPVFYEQIQIINGLFVATSRQASILGTGDTRVPL